MSTQFVTTWFGPKDDNCPCEVCRLIAGKERKDMGNDSYSVEIDDPSTLRAIHTAMEKTKNAYINWPALDAEIARLAAKKREKEALFRWRKRRTGDKRLPS